jgi:non-ribosomal peptide synthetase component E (peptide arylation enzyme)
MTNTMLTLLSRGRLDEAYASGHWRDDTIFSLAKAHASTHPDRIAVRDRSGHITYSRLIARAEALSGEMSKRLTEKEAE